MSLPAGDRPRPGRPHSPAPSAAPRSCPPGRGWCQAPPGAAGRRTVRAPSLLEARGAALRGSSCPPCPPRLADQASGTPRSPPCGTEPARGWAAARTRGPAPGSCAPGRRAVGARAGGSPPARRGAGAGAGAVRLRKAAQRECGEILRAAHTASGLGWPGAGRSCGELQDPWRSSAPSPRPGPGSS